MNCERIREQLPECLAGRLDKTSREGVIEHLETCSGCRAELAELGTVWRGMEAMTPPEPDRGMRTRFANMLETYKAGLEQAAPRKATEVRPSEGRRFAWWPAQPVWQMAIAAALLIGGVLAGRYQATPREMDPAVAQLKGQVEALRQLVSLSLLQEQSAGDRMRGVSYSEQVSRPDAEMEQALVRVVTRDPNVNVRLSAVDALQKYSSKPEVRRALTDAVPMQDSPLVQMALVDLLSQWNDHNSAPALRKLAADTRTDEMVRQRATLAVHKMEGKQ